MKKLNIKALVINHAEKMVFGLFAFIVLIVLAKTTWARYPKTPDELMLEIKKVRDKISAPTNVWPPDQEKSYKVVDFSDKARQLFAPLAPIALARYSFTPPLFHPLYRKDEPKREPVYEPVQQLTAKAGLAALSVLDESARSQADEPQMAAATPAKEAMKPDDEFGPAATGKPVPGAAAAPGGRPPAGAPAQGPAANPIVLRPLGVPVGNDGMAMMASQQSDVKARGVRFIAIRGVFPLRKQIENYKNALRLTESEASNLLEITDFVLERQTATAGANPWPNDKWDIVGVESALEVLNECSELDPSDPVPAAMRDAVITMNLPLRLIGRWGEYATHPRIKEDELKGDAIEAQNKALESMGAALSESNSPEGGKAAPRKKGLSGVQRDPKQLVRSIKSTPGAMDMYKQIMSSQQGSSSSSAMMPRPTVSGPPMPQMGSASMMRGASDLDKLVVNSRYLLFRFFDFDVQSGMAYRYRVTLKLRNPNFELTPEELGGADIEITKGEERETPPSNISNPEVVPTTSNYFLKDIEREPYHDEKFKTTDKPVAQLSVFDWDTTLGTVVKDGLNIPTIGGFIGGVMGLSPKETLVLDLVEQVLKKKKDLKFSTLDVLVDVESDRDVAIDQHPDLKLPANSTRGMSRIGLVEEALVATGFGEIKTIDPISEKSKEDWWNDRVERERKSFKEGEPPKTTSRLGALMGEGGAEEGGHRKKKRRKSPLMMPSSSAGMQQSSPAEGSGSMQRGNR